MTRQALFFVCLLLGLLASTTARAQAPGLIPLQGVLVDGANAPLDGSYQFTLTLYGDAAGATVLATEVQTVTVTEGYFTAFFGATGPIDPSTFRDNGELYLGLAIDSDPEMSPLFEIGTAPWAGFSEFAGEADDSVMLGGQPASAYRLASDPIDFSSLSNVPSDADTLGALACADGQVAQWSTTGSAWTCATVSASGVETDPVFGASAAAGITSADIASWGQSETDPAFGASPAAGITSADIAAWGQSETDPVFGASPAAGITSSDIAAWGQSETDPAFGASPAAGITSADIAAWGLPEGDPLFGASAASTITTSDISTWNSATDTLASLPCLDGEVVQYSTSLGQWICATVTASGTETDPVFGASPAGTITTGQLSDWTVAYGWGDHAVAGYVSTEVDPVWTTFQGTGGTITGALTLSPTVSGDLTINNPLENESGLLIQDSQSASELGAVYYDAGANALNLYVDDLLNPRLSLDATGAAVSGALTASAFVGDGSQLTGLTDADTLGSLQCSNDEVPVWSGGAWNCGTATVSETDPVFSAFQTTGGVINGSLDLVSNNVMAGSFIGDGSLLTGITDNDTLGGLSCSNGQVAQWNGSSWVCATVSGGGGAETDPVWSAFQQAGGTISGAVTLADSIPGLLYDPGSSTSGYLNAVVGYSQGGADYADWAVYLTTPTGADLVLNYDDLGDTFEVDGKITATGSVTAPSFVGNGAGLTNLNETDPAWTTFQGSGGTITGPITSSGSSQGVTLDPTNNTVSYTMTVTDPSAVGKVDWTLKKNAPGGSGVDVVKWDYYGDFLRVDGSLVVLDDIEVFGHVSSRCPTGTDEAAGWCIENLGAGSASVPTPANWATAVTNCNNKGMQLCPLEALMACDQLEPTTTGCEDATDGTGGTYDLWTADVQVPTGGGDAYSNLVTFDSNNNIDLESETATNSWLCCTAIYNP